MTEEKYLVQRDRDVMLAPCYWNAISQTADIKTKKIYGVNVPRQWLIFNHIPGRFKSIVIAKEWQRTGQTIAAQFLKDENFFNNLKDQYNEAVHKTEDFLKECKGNKLAEQSFSELIKFVNSIKEAWLEYDRTGVLAWFVAGDEFKKIVAEKLPITADDLNALSTPEVKTYVSQLETEILEKIIAIKADKLIAENEAINLAEKYGWIPFGYDGLEYWDQNYFIKQLEIGVKANNAQELLDKIKQADQANAKQRIALIKKNNINEEGLRLINILNSLAVWTDERKWLAFQLHYYYSQALLELSKRYDLPYKNLKYLLTEELKDLAEKKDELLKISQQRIDQPFMLYFDNNGYQLVSEAEKNRVLEEIKIQTQVSEIKGQVASVGQKKIYQGQVKVIFSVAESSKVNNGDFIVATMTSPEYIVAMGKAAGFITDEGGVTCHAAIVAREMNKPCIIGTKNATQVLKDGDQIEMDLDHGTIKIIK